MEKEQNNNTLPNGAAIAGMVCGILSIILWWFPVIGLVLAIVGTSVSGKAISNVNKGNASGKGMAIAGLVCGIVGLVFSLPFTLALLAI